MSNSRMKVERMLAVLRDMLPSPSILCGRKRASVALILRRSNAKLPLEVLLIQRATRATDPWSAHLAFPGGRRDPLDQDDMATAVRETKEEVGIDLTSPSFELVGRLNDRPIKRAASTGGVLSAFAFLQVEEPSYKLTLQPDEVSSAFWLPIRCLHASSGLVCSYPMQHPLRVERPGARLLSSLKDVLGLLQFRMPALDVLPHAVDHVKCSDAPHVVLWGMTLDIIGDFLDFLGLRRVDRPVALPNNRLFVAFMSTIAEIRWLFTRYLFRQAGTSLERLCLNQ